jgi:uncharacterized protein (DUF2236 family)
MTFSPDPVFRDESEALIAAVDRSISDPQAGIFGPGSMSWQINRESALFLGAARAALLQLAHPWVATALAQHSSLMARPIARFHSTFCVLFAMIFGSRNQALAAARHLYTVHTYIRGEMSEDVGRWERGTPYEANEIAALRWVYATLVESAVLGYESVMPPLTIEELAGYFDESKTLAALFGVPAASLPLNWAQFLNYCRETEASDQLGVSSRARAMGRDLLRGADSWIKPPAWYCALTTAWLPERLRAEFGLPFGDQQLKAAEGARCWLPQVYQRLPSALRFVGPWHDAQARLIGKPASLAVRLSNRFWIGEPKLPFG